MRRWSRGRLAVPGSVADVSGWERRASIWVGFVVVVVVCEVDGCVLAVGCGGEGSAGGVSGWEGELAGGARVVGEAMVEVGVRGDCQREDAVRTRSGLFTEGSLYADVDDK